jgi:hypothetical protein
MKKSITGFTAIILMLTGCTEDVDKWSDVQRDMNVGGAMPYTKFYSPKIFDVVDLDNSSVNFTLFVGAEGEGAGFTGVKLYKSYNGGTEVLHKAYVADQIPAEVSITVSEALQDLSGVTRDSLKGGDYMDWRFEMEFPDGTGGEYNVDAAGTFPDFRTYVASSPDFDISGEYTMNLLLDEVGLASQTAAVTISKVGGTANSQYLLDEGAAELVLNLFELNLPYRILYIGNNVFLLWPRAEDWLGDYFGFVGTITRDPSTGVLTFDGVWDQSFGGISGYRLQYELVPG